MSWDNESDVMDQLRSGGLILDGALRVGCMVRCCVDGDRGKKRSGWYKLFEFATNGGQRLLVGAFGSWKTGEQGKIIINAKRHPISRDERARIRKQMDADRKAQEVERKRKADAAATKARRWAARCVKADDKADYLQRKGVQPYGVKVSPRGAVVIPLSDVHGNISGLQIIYSRTEQADRIREIGRDKTFMPAGLVKRGRFYQLGKPQSGGVLLVAEGFATAASIYEATGLPISVAFDAGNLKPVAEQLAKRWQPQQIIICADDDYLCHCSQCKKQTLVANAACAQCGKAHGRNNPGAVAARAAADAVNAQHNPTVIAPIFVERLTKLTDFNDLHQAEGLERVGDQVLAVVIAAPAEVVGAGKSHSGGRGLRVRLKALISVDEAVDRFALVYGVRDTLFDFDEHRLVPKSCMLDILQDRGWAEVKRHSAWRAVRTEEVGFDPACTDPDILCNMWGGWPTEPDDSGSCERLLELLEYLCSADENPRALYKWVLCWLAYPIQNPGAKMKTALAVHGGQGAGKNMFFEAIMKMYGIYGRIITQADVEDKFNDWASRKLFMIANEVVARQELFHQKNKLKGLITDDWIRINPKGMQAHDEKNHMNMVFLSNEVQPVHLENDDRRYAVIWTPEKQTQKFYDAIISERDHGGIAALHHYLLHDVDLGDFHPGTMPPDTSARRELIAIGKESPDRFIESWLAGELDLPVTACAFRDIYAHYRRWCGQQGERFSYSAIKFGSRLRLIKGVSSAKKPVLVAVGKNAKMTVVVLPDDDPKPDGSTWMAWLSERIDAFNQATKQPEDEF